MNQMSNMKSAYWVAGVAGLVGAVIGLCHFENAARSPGDVAAALGNSDRPPASVRTSRDPSLRALSAPQLVSRDPASMARKPADPYQGLQLLDSYRTQPDESGHFQIVKVYQREHNTYPLLRVKEHWVAGSDGSSQQQITQEMAGDHVLVRLNPNATADDLQAFAVNIGGSIRTRLQYSGLYVLEFNGQKANAMDQVLNQIASRPDLVSSSEPNYFMQLNH
jgi:hypothetical protein